MENTTNKKLVFSYRDDKLGMGEVQFTWQPGCRWIAFCGDTRVIVISDRLGKKIHEFQLKSGGKVKSMEFDPEGDSLAIIQEGSSIVVVINVYTKKNFDLEIDRNNRDRPTCIKWNQKDPFLAICTELGLIYFYNKKTDKLVPCALNHSKSIVTCDWNNEGNLVTGGEDKTIAVTTRTGTPILQGTKLKDIPRMIKWSRQKTNEKNSLNTTISTVLSNKSILIYDTNKKSSPIELALDTEYGTIVCYQWFGDGYIAIAFSKGNISIISTHITEIKNEVQSLQPFKTGIDDFSVCEEVNRLAVAGENSVKIFDTNNYTEIVEEKIDVPYQAGRINKIEWSQSGHIILVSTLLGGLFAYNVVVNESFAVSGKIN